MFSIPAVRRAERALNDEKALLAKVGEGRTMVLALADKPYPYAVAVNYAPLIHDNELYLIFHGAGEGRKARLLKRNPHTGFFITLKDEIVNPGSCAATNHYQSLAGEGVAELLEGELALKALRVLLEHSFQGEMATHLEEKMAPMLKRTAVYALKVTGLAYKGHEKA